MITKVMLVTLVSGLLSVSDGLSQGILNGGFELYDRQKTFLPDWKVVLHASYGDVDFSTSVNGVAGSTIPYAVARLEVGRPSVNTPFDVPGLKGGEYFYWANSAGVGLITDLEQRVVVPEDANSLQFRAFRGSPGYLSVRLNGNLESQVFRNWVDVAPLKGYVADWWIDVSSYRNQTVDLMFSVNIQTGLDDIQFSSEPVPEPGIMALLGLAGAWLLMRRKVAKPCRR